MDPEVQKGFAYLIGRAVAAEKALQTTIASSKRGLALAEIMKTNLGIAREHLTTNLQRANISVEYLPTAFEGFDAATKAALLGATSGKYLLPDRK